MSPSRVDEPGLASRIGDVAKTTRESIGWTQRELATRLATSQSAIQRLESGRQAFLDVRLVSAAFEVLGVRIGMDNATLGLAQRRDQRDLVHACCLAYVGRRLRPLGWDVRLEVEVGSGRIRGWIDLLAYRAVDRSLLCIELKTELDDIGRIQRSVGWYIREAPAAARAIGWRPHAIGSALLILLSVENDVRIRLNRGLLRETFPGSARDLTEWIAAPGRLPPSSIAMIDPRSRRSNWLRPTTTEGRRSVAPYTNYASAAEAIKNQPDRQRVARSEF